MCVDTLITYTACNCKIMIKTICFDHIQHTLKQEDRNPCPKKAHDLYTMRTNPNTCFLKSGSKLEDGRIFRHGSHRTRNYYEFERDPNDPKKRWERWDRKNRGKTRQRADSMEANISAGEDRMMNLEADSNNSHKERESQIREWQEETKNNRPPRVKVEDEEKTAKKEQPASGRKTVNNVLYDMFDPRSDDEFSDDDWGPEPKVEVDPGDTVPWSSKNARSYCDPTRASGNNTNQDEYNSPKSRDDGGFFKDHNTNAVHGAETNCPATPHSQFNFNPPFTGTHTKYHPDKSNSSHGSSSARTSDASAMDLGSPKHRAPLPAKLPPRRHDLYRPRYPSMPVDANSSFWAGHLNQVGSSRPPPYFPSPSTLAPYNAVAGGLSCSMGVGDESTASGDGEIRGVYGNYTGGESQERENKKARVERSGAGNGDFDNTMSSTRDNGNGVIPRNEGEKQTADSMNDAGDDIEMVE